MQTLETAKVYGRIAWLRRQVLVQLALRRVAAGLIAAVAGFVALGFGTAAGYMALADRLGPIAAAAIVACLWLLLAVILAIYAASTPKSVELDALEQMEIEARARTSLAVGQLTGVVARAEAMSGTMTVGLALWRTLRRLMRSRG